MSFLLAWLYANSAQPLNLTDSVFFFKGFISVQTQPSEGELLSSNFDTMSRRLMNCVVSLTGCLSNQRATQLV